MQLHRNSTWWRRPTRHRCPVGLAAALWTSLLVGLVVPPRCGGQEPPPGTTLALETFVDEAGNEARSYLPQIDRFVAAGQWDDAVETLRRAVETFGPQLIPATARGTPDGFERFTTVLDACQARLALWHAAAPEALALYRARVEPAARAILEQARIEQDTSRLAQVGDQWPMTRAGEEALQAWGELSLEQGHYAQARMAWERLHPALRVPRAAGEKYGVASGLPLWLLLGRLQDDAQWRELAGMLAEARDSLATAVPDAVVDVPRLRAALAWVSLLAGDAERAGLELRILRETAPEASGWLAGRTGNYVQILTDLAGELAASEPRRPVADDWPTFAGNVTRNYLVPRGLDPARRVVWEVDLPPIDAQRDVIGRGRGRVAEAARPLSYHPVLWKHVVLVADVGAVRAYDRMTGLPAWPVRGVNDQPGDDNYGVVYRWEGAMADVGEASEFGVPRCTLTIQGDQLFARLGVARASPNMVARVAPLRHSCLIGLDLETQRLLFDRIEPEAGWEFEGPPLRDGARLFVAERRREEGQEQARIVCYDAQRGTALWRRPICRGQVAAGAPRTTLLNNLLSLQDGILYYNTNLGAVAAVRTDDGGLRWLVRYPRAAYPSLNPDLTDRHYFRDLTPCLVAGDLVVVAPADSDRIFTLDALTGTLVWSTGPQIAADAVHLLGVAAGQLLASGDSLYWFDVATGRLRGTFPVFRSPSPVAPTAGPRGYGRGVVAGGRIYWPTEQGIYVLDVATRRPVRQPIELASFGARPGNLVLGGGQLIIAGEDRMMVLGEEARHVVDR